MPYYRRNEKIEAWEFNPENSVTWPDEVVSKLHNGTRVFFTHKNNSEIKPGYMVVTVTRYDDEGSRYQFVCNKDEFNRKYVSIQNYNES